MGERFEPGFLFTDTQEMVGDFIVTSLVFLSVFHH